MYLLSASTPFDLSLASFLTSEILSPSVNMLNPFFSSSSFAYWALQMLIVINTIISVSVVLIVTLIRVFHVTSKL
ncbi:hypothetical protein D3C87_1769350 [compost metagenome]